MGSERPRTAEGGRKEEGLGGTWSGGLVVSDRERGNDS